MTCCFRALQKLLLKTGRKTKEIFIKIFKDIKKYWNYHPLQFNFYFFVFLFGLLFYLIFLKDLPNPYFLSLKPPNASTKIYDRNGNLLYKVYRDENRTILSLKDIPDIVKKATIAIEDKNFYSHKGISLKGVSRAIYYDLFVPKEKRPHDLQGGSTITQQLVKNSLLSPERTLLRKVKEIVLASIVELLFTKDEILEMYFNTVAYGGPNYGVEEAAQNLFGKPISEVNLAEAALIAALPAAPTMRNPFGANPHLAKTYQKQVLRQMVEQGYITLAEAQKAEKEVLVYAPQKTFMKAPHFVEYVKAELVKKYGQQVVEKGGLNVYTTLDLNIQKMAEEAVIKNVRTNEWRYNLHNGAALVTKPQTGEILAMVGSVDFWDKNNDGNVNITTSLQQPGSSIKIVNYAYALEHAGYTPTSILMDTPITFTDPWGYTFTPVNYDGKTRGRVTLKQALALSLNIPATKVLNSYGVDKMIEQGKKMGITTWNEPERYGLSLTLGAAEVKMTDMAVVFGSVANLGHKVPLVSIRKIVSSKGKVLMDIEKPPSLWDELTRKVWAADIIAMEKGEPVISPYTAWQLIDILSDNSARAPEFGFNSPLRITQNNKDVMVFVKTGTSNEFRDNWTNGCSPDYCVLTWVGNNNNEPMYRIASGITGAAPMWHEIMSQLTKENPDKTFPVPQGMTEVEVCAENNLLPCECCKTTKKAYFVPGTEPKQKCSCAPPPEVCQARKKEMEQQGKPAEEIVKALAGCPLQ